MPTKPSRSVSGDDGLAVADEGDVLFDSYTATRKVDNLRANPRAALVIGWDDGVSVQVEGSAEILWRIQCDACGKVYLAQFPGSRALADGFSLIRIVPDWLRQYDTRPDPGPRNGSESLVGPVVFVRRQPHLVFVRGQSGHRTRALSPYLRSQSVMARRTTPPRVMEASLS